MTTWAILATNHTTLNSDTGGEATPANGWDALDSLASRASEPSDGRLARMRRRVDLLLAEMLGDDDDDQLGPVSAAGPETDGPEEAGPETARSDRAGPETARSGTAGPDLAGPDEDFWGPGESSEGPASGYRSRHRLAGLSKERGQRDSHRSKPRHAAQSASLFTSFTRGFTGVKLTGRFAAHAAW